MRLDILNYEYSGTNWNKINERSKFSLFDVGLEEGMEYLFFKGLLHPPKTLFISTKWIPQKKKRASRKENWVQDYFSHSGKRSN